jgi:hypothetical protein
MKLSEEKQVHYKALCEKICLIKNTVTPADFYQNLQPENETIIVASPHIFPLSVFYGFGKKDYFACGKEHSEFLESVNKNEFGKKYDTAIMDLDKEVPYQGKRVNTFTQWFRHVISQVLKDGGTLKGKFPLSLILQLQDKDYDWFQVEKIKIEDTHCFVEVTKVKKHKNTVIEYSTGEVVEVDLHQDAILHHYDKDAYDYIFNLEKSTEYKRITFSGSEVAEKIKTVKDNAEKESKYGLVVYSNIPKLRVEKLESTNVSSGSDCYLFDIQEERDSYFDIFHNKKVIALSKNLSYNQTINTKIQSYLINPAIFQYAS